MNSKLSIMEIGTCFSTVFPPFLPIEHLHLFQSAVIFPLSLKLASHTFNKWDLHHLCLLRGIIVILWIPNVRPLSVKRVLSSLPETVLIKSLWHSKNPENYLISDIVSNYPFWLISNHTLFLETGNRYFQRFTWLDGLLLRNIPQVEASSKPIYLLYNWCQIDVYIKKSWKMISKRK